MQNSPIKLYVVVFLELIPENHVFLLALDRNSPLKQM